METDMQAIQDVLKRQPHATCGETKRSHAANSSDRLLSDKAIGQLFARFQVMFGHRWTSTIDDESVYRLAVAEWKTALEGISLNEVSEGLRRTRKRSGDSAAWPPSSTEFRQLCRPHREPYERPEFQSQALPQKTARPEVAREYLAKIKAELNIK